MSKPRWVARGRAAIGRTSTRNRQLATMIVVAALAPAAAAQPAAPPAGDPPAQAGEPPPATAAPPGAKPSADDIDLSSLGLDVATPAFDDKLNVYGFLDLTYQYIHAGTSSPFLPDSRTFTLGNLNVYLAKNLTASWRSLAEVRFMYVPNGSQNPDGTIVTTTATDTVNLGRPIEWGTISIERAYIEYDLHPRLTVRAGHWLTPYGIWNTDHGSPVITAVSRPYTIGDALFPEHQTGLELFGTAPVGDYKIGYHATLSNGRSETEITTDTDKDLAFGGRAFFEGSNFKLGVSGYTGRSTGATTSLTRPPVIFDENAFAADLQVDVMGVHLQGEAIFRRREFVDANRPLTVTGMPQPDGTDFGGYVLASYRFDKLWNITPYGIFETYRPRSGSPGAASILGDVSAGTLRLNFRPSPNVVLKVQSLAAKGTDGAIYPDYVYLTSAQAAWVF